MVRLLRIQSAALTPASQCCAVCPPRHRPHHCFSEKSGGSVRRQIQKLIQLETLLWHFNCTWQNTCSAMDYEKHTSGSLPQNVCGARTCTTHLLHLSPFPLILHPLSGGTSSLLTVAWTCWANSSQLRFPPTWDAPPPGNYTFLSFTSSRALFRCHFTRKAFPDDLDIPVSSFCLLTCFIFLP